MKGMEFLFVVAEVSVVYVGFATLIVVVVQQFSGARAEIEVIRLQSMMLLSLLAVAFSLFPDLVFSLDLPVENSMAQLFLRPWFALAGLQPAQDFLDPFRAPQRCCPIL